VATVEYVAVVVVVGLALAVGGAVVDARALPGTVAGQLRKAYCLVAGGDCLGAGGPRPCVVASRARSERTEVAILVVRLRDGRVVLRERLSDGTERITVGTRAGAGAGVRLGMRIAGRGVDVDAAAGLDVGAERTFVVADARAGDRLLARLDAETPPVGGALRDLLRFTRGAGGDEQARAITVASRDDAQAALDALGLEPELGALGEVVGTLRVERSGRRSIGLRLPREALAALSTPVAALDLGADGAVEAELVFWPRGGLEALVLRGAGSGGTGQGMRVEAEARLDLADPAARALVRRLAGGDLGAAGALAERVADRARIDVRRYATTRTRDEDGVTILGSGGARTVVESTARLVSAEGREPGGSWGPNLDCAANA
jgi:hypothetical protein